METGRPHDPSCDGWRRGELAIRCVTNGETGRPRNPSCDGWRLGGLAI